MPSETAPDATAERAFDYDVLIVGGGPAGCSAAVFTARYGLRTVAFDRGSSSLRRSAHLANYLGFPAGVDIDTFYDLMHDHVREAGAELVADTVEAVSRQGDGFRAETGDGRTPTAAVVVAATKYDWEYLRGLVDADELVDVRGEGEAAYEEFSESFAAWNGRTSVEGLFVAGPNAGVGDQAIIAAGQGAQVGREIVEDVRREAGYPGDLAEYYDWLRREEERSGEWAERDRWREWFDERVADADGEIDPAERERLREAYIDERFAKYVSPDERARRERRAHRRLAEHLDEAAVETAADERPSGEAGADRDGDGDGE